MVIFRALDRPASETDMPLTQANVEHIAHLARLAIEPVEMPAYTAALDRVLGLMAELQAAATEGLEPLAHPLEAEQRLRVDKVTEHVAREPLQSVAPSTSDGLYLVPRVIE